MTGNNHAARYTEPNATIMKKTEYTSRSECETSKLGASIAIAMSSGPGHGDLLLLAGDLGAGKSVLARAIIRQLSGNAQYEVPSPTYTICHEYDVSPSVAHYDLYRLSGIDELDELGWEEQLLEGVAIMEWPERCFDTMPEGAVHIMMDSTTGEDRLITIQGDGDFMNRIRRSMEISDFLQKAGKGDAVREPLSADASARSYELVHTPHERLLLMNSPAMTDGPPVRDGKPYSQIAHLAESVDAFVAIARLLREKQASAPEIPARDLENGLLLVEHMGNGSILDPQGVPILERYQVAAEFLAELHQHEFDGEIKLEPGNTYHVPEFDEQAFLIEAGLLIDWYIPAEAGDEASMAQHASFENIWLDLHKLTGRHEKSLVLRDFHSPNIIWIPERKETRRIGVIDFQDALIGPSTYDVASLAQDARVDIPPEFEKQVVDHYIKCRTRLPKRFDEEGFRESYAIMAAQRATKILGIFIRLDRRDGKSGYLKHLPRIKNYLDRNLAHQSLAPYRDWLGAVIKL